LIGCADARLEVVAVGLERAARLAADIRKEQAARQVGARGAIGRRGVSDGSR
jgi:hypothetical protein